MGLRSLAFGLMGIATPLLLVACQAAPTQLPAPANATPAEAPGLQPNQTAVPAVSPSPTAVRTLPPSPTAVPAATAAPAEPSTKTEVQASSNSPHPTPSPQPATTNQTGDQHVPAPQPTGSLRQVRSAVFYEQNGLTLEYYWPLDFSNLSADETEILAYNESGGAIEFKTPKMTFTENGRPRAQLSGTWEKFPSRYSWDRIEYISIPPSPYQGEPLIVYPGEKAKIHWHLERIASTDTIQSVALELRVTTGVRTETIKPTLVRDSDQRDTVVATVPEPIQGPTPEPTHSESNTTQQVTSNDGHTGADGTTSGVIWSIKESIWSPNGTPPDCAEPFVLQTPVDMNIVTSALWPGQVRGGYKGHGGFRFDANLGDDVTVRAPIGSHLVQAARYLEGADEQYLLFFSVPCGYFYRFDHVRVLSPKLADALSFLPPPVADDSRTSFINPPVWIEQGEVVATSVGIVPSNIFIDFGLYDVRTPNNVTPNPAWANLFAADIEFGHYGVCFFDYLPGNHGDIMRSLPTGKEGPISDYCQ